TVNGDTNLEPDETLQITLSSPGNATFNGGGATLGATGTILNDDIALPNLMIVDNNGASPGKAEVIEGNPGDDHRVVFNVTLDAVSGLDTVISYTFTDINTNSADFDHTAGSFTILAGNLTGSFEVQVNEDLTPEPHETFGVVLTSSQINNGPVTGTAVILNDDANIYVEDNNGSSMGQASVTEGNSGSSNPLTFTVRLDQPLTTNVTYQYSTSDGTATLTDLDYIGTGSTLPQVTISAGSLSSTVTVYVIGDNKVEQNETVNLNVTELSARTLNASTSATGLIINDDSEEVAAPPPPPAAPPVRIPVASPPPPRIVPVITPVALADDQLELPSFEPENPNDSLPDIMVTDIVYSRNTTTDMEGYFSVYLTTKPDAPVTIKLQGRNLPYGTVYPASITFTPDNWDVPQVVTVSEESTEITNNQQLQKIVTEPAESADDDYNNIDPRDLDIWRPHNFGNNEQPADSEPAQNSEDVT
ncbi:MAG: hypothetical protein H7A37_09315, partial [Chlamydiales bacterium]|nr:hypothetical protein [Chlamydiales bacterium]